MLIIGEHFACFNSFTSGNDFLKLFANHNPEIPMAYCIIVGKANNC
jgi:hypothetical protein